MAIDDLVQELERSYEEARDRMADPAVFNDHKTAADAGRRFKELEEPYALTQEWRAVREDLDAARHSCARAYGSSSSLNRRPASAAVLWSLKTVGSAMRSRASS